MSTTFLQGTAAVAGIAVINSIANLAGYVSPYVLGVVKDVTHSVTFGLVLIAGALTVGGLVTLRCRGSRCRTAWRNWPDAGRRTLWARRRLRAGGVEACSTMPAKEFHP
jgi:hypothetical protein